MSNMQETDNEFIQNPVSQAKHPAVAFRQITTAQRNKAELKRKLASIKDQVKKLGKEINDEMKQVEKNPKLIVSIKDKIDQLRQLNAHIDVKPIDDAVEYLKTVPAHPRLRLQRLMRLLTKTLKIVLKIKTFL